MNDINYDIIHSYTDKPVSSLAFRLLILKTQSHFDIDYQTNVIKT